MGRKIRGIEEVVTDSSGNQTTRKITYSVPTDSDNFFMTFIDSLSGLLNIRNATDIRVITMMNTMAKFNTGQVLITQEDRKKMLDTLQMDNQVLSNSLKRLKEAGIISGERGIYEINPLVFWKGTTNERKKILAERGFEVKLKFMPSEQFEQESGII